MNIEDISSSGIIEKNYLINKWCHVCIDESSCGHDLVVVLKHYNAEQLIIINLVIVIFSSFLSICLICSTIEERNRIVKTKKRLFPVSNRNEEEEEERKRRERKKEADRACRKRDERHSCHRL